MIILTNMKSWGDLLDWETAQIVLVVGGILGAISMFAFFAFWGKYEKNKGKNHNSK